MSMTTDDHDRMVKTEKSNRCRLLDCIIYCYILVFTAEVPLNVIQATSFEQLMVIS